MKKWMKPVLVLSIYLMAVSPLTAYAAHGHGGSGRSSGASRQNGPSRGNAHTQSSNGQMNSNVGGGNHQGQTGSSVGGGNHQGQTGSSADGKHDAGSTLLAKHAGTAMAQLSVSINGIVSANNHNAKANTNVLRAAGKSGAAKKAMQMYQHELQVLNKNVATFRKDISEVKTLMADAESAGQVSLVQTGSQELQSINQTMQHALKLAKQQTPGSNRGGAEKGLARAITVLEAIDARLGAESSALANATNTLTALIGTLENRLQQGTVTGSVYGNSTATGSV